MSYQEKRIGASLFAGALMLAAYCIYAFGKVNAGAVAADDLKFWASTMLIFIGIGIGVTIIIQIIFHILFSVSLAVKQKIQDDKFDDKNFDRTIQAEMVEDERDKLVEMKATRVGFTIAGIGFVGSLLTLVFNGTLATMLNVLYFSFSAGSLLEGIAQLYYYRKGV